MHSLPPLSTSPTRMVYVLPWMNLHWHITITQSPQFTLGCTLDIVHSTGFDKCVITCVDHYSVIQSRVTAVKILQVLSFTPPHIPTPDKLDTFYMKNFENKITQWFKKSKLVVQAWSNKQNKLLDFMFACGQK